MNMPYTFSVFFKYMNYDKVLNNYVSVVTLACLLVLWLEYILLYLRSRRQISLLVPEILRVKQKTEISTRNLPACKLADICDPIVLK
jgi:hypothetical protein